MPTYSLPGSRGVTYSAQVTEVGAGPQGNKDMASIFNPSGSGKVFELVGFSVQCSDTGANVIVLYELRRISAYSGGDTITPSKRDTSSGSPSAEVRADPTSTTGTEVLQNYVMQSNTAISPQANFLTFGVVGEEAVIIRPGEGVCAHQVTGNNGDFHIGLVWVER